MKPKSAISHLRISVTQSCNMSCMYCHREGEDSTKEEMGIDTIADIAKQAKKFGVTHIKITGGEPLLRQDICKIVQEFSKWGYEDISLTTNGTLLPKFAQQLKSSGLDRINIGCDSIDNPLIKNLALVKDAISAAKNAGFTRIKLNMVVLRDINEKDIPEMIEFCRKQKLILQLIELIDLNNGLYDNHYFDLSEIEKGLEMNADMVITRQLQSRKQYVFNDSVIEVVGPSKKEFCENCCKIRITSDGFIKPCLRTETKIPYIGLRSFKDAYSKKIKESKCA